MKAAITDRIPHREPFLWVDSIIARTVDTITTAVTFDEHLELFRGHFPGHPLVPGVILCEAIFQSGALLLSEKLPALPGDARQLPVLTRIYGAKFKAMVYPGDTCTITVGYRERIAAAHILRGKLAVGGKTAVQVEFACTITGC